jgi:hypothetical protein
MSKRNYEKYSPEHKKKLMKKSKSELVDKIFKSWQDYENLLALSVKDNLESKEVLVEIKQLVEEIKKEVK